MPEPSGHKYKGLKGVQARQGLGRLRRANSKDEARTGGWERHHDDENFVDSHGHQQRTANGGDTLLARFNRLAGLIAEQESGGEPGAICGFAGTTVQVRLDDGGEVPCQVRQVLKKRISGVKNPLCVGDRVRIERGAAAGGPAREDEAVITAVCPRTNQLARADSHNRALIHVFAANLDCLVVVAALAEPDLKHGLIDRYLLIAAANDIPAALVLTKADLADAAAPLALYRGLGVPTFAVVANTGGGELDALRDHLRGLTCVVAGQSGVGKSSLVNALYPRSAARIGVVADAGHGRHTTTSARSYVLEGGGRLVDTPGIRECAVSGITALDAALLMPDLAALHHACRFADCTHSHEPDCAVIAAVADGRIAASRYASYRSIVAEDLTEQA
jgi:ribosome biogenesis GTPase